jgi:predicted TIM-barrel fold metal-dependent hydrolase
MIIDVHRHLVTEDWFPEPFWAGFARMMAPLLARWGRPPDIEAVRNGYFPRMFDIDGSRHLDQMERAGIDRAAVFLMDVGLLVGEAPVGLEEQTRVLFDVARKHPDRIVPFAHIDPRRPGAVDFIRKCVQEHGARGLKLHPGAGFDPSQKQTLDLIEVAAGFNLPVVTHTGPSIAPTVSRYCEPIYLDEMLLRFPEVNFIAGHLAYGYHELLVSLGRVRPNLYADISGWQVTARTDYDLFARTLRRAADVMGPERVLFGTDGPYLWPTLSDRDYVQAVRDLTTRAPADARFTSEEVDLILGGNAARLLNL